LPREIILKNHPNLDLGSRNVLVRDAIYISMDDAIKLKPGNEIRLIELYNIRINEIRKDGKRLTAVGSYSGDEIKADLVKIQWVAKNDAHALEILVPKELFKGDNYNAESLQVWKGVCESYVARLKPDSKVQFVRVGFCRIDHSGLAIYTHK
jgi:glutamyl-tRNA synthetase